MLALLGPDLPNLTFRGLLRLRQWGIANTAVWMLFAPSGVRVSVIRGQRFH
jgi:hypothetical protein